MSGSGLIINPSTGKAASADVVDLTIKGAVVLSNFHVLAQRFNWSIRCESCGQPVQGNNGNPGTDKYLSVACGCKEYRCEAKDLVGRI